MNKQCMICNENQMYKIGQLMNLESSKQEKLLSICQKYMDECDMSKTNPEIMGDIYKQISPVLGGVDPYKGVKRKYNNLLLESINEVDKLVDESGDSLELALKIAIVGNLIDFAASHTFTDDDVLNLIDQAKQLELAIDDSRTMFDKLSMASSLLYLGDNCGEIVLDMCFIKRLKKEFPNLSIYYGVRGQAIVNDVTYEDALMVGIDRYATIISNGDGALGTVLHNTSEAFQKTFNEADVVIAKGQGNYEGLYRTNKENLFYLFMAKCQIVAQPLGIDKMSIVCLQNNK